MYDNHYVCHQKIESVMVRCGERSRILGNGL